MEVRCVKVAPIGDKPLIIEGDLFVGNYEGASEVVYGSTYQEGEVAGRRHSFRAGRIAGHSAEGLPRGRLAHMHKTLTPGEVLDFSEVRGLALIHPLPLFGADSPADG